MNTVRKAVSVGTMVLMVAARCVQAEAIVRDGAVTGLIAWAEYGNGDFIFRLSGLSPCNGYWLAPSQSGFKTSIAWILQARASGESVRVVADTALRWPGSGDAYCKVSNVGLPY